MRMVTHQRPDPPSGSVDCCKQPVMHIPNSLELRGRPLRSSQHLVVTAVLDRCFGGG